MNANHREDRVWLWMFLAAMALLGATRWHFSHQSGGFTPVASRKTAPDVVLPQLSWWKSTGTHLALWGAFFGR